MTRKSPVLFLVMTFILLYGCTSTRQVASIKPNTAPQELRDEAEGMSMAMEEDDVLYASYGNSYNSSVYDVVEKKLPKVYKDYIGMEYRLGANPDESSSADCSHLVSALMRKCLSNTNYAFAPYYVNSRGIYKNTYKIDVSQVKPGDVLIFNSNGRINHTGMVTRKSDDVVYFVHASSTNGVVVTSTASRIWDSYWQERFHSFRRWKPTVFMADDNLSTMYASAGIKKKPSRLNAGSYEKPEQLAQNAVKPAVKKVDSAVRPEEVVEVAKTSIKTKESNKQNTQAHDNGLVAKAAKTTDKVADKVAAAPVALAKTPGNTGKKNQVAEKVQVAQVSQKTDKKTAQKTNTTEKSQTEKSQTAKKDNVKDSKLQVAQKKSETTEKPQIAKKQAPEKMLLAKNFEPVGAKKSLIALKAGKDKAVDSKVSTATKKAEPVKEKISNTNKVAKKTARS
ncbi:MAG: NlpC/P60 family protein [Candidatus Magnetoovum sp. WYHC-5]|nr:NlpC/P60 family protein [Candidatus Magnetoovum sp. WYHC-5]